MGRKGTVDNHPKRDLIEKCILAGKSDEWISNNFDLSFQAVKRYRTGKMASLLADAEADRVEGLVHRIEEYLGSIDEMFYGIRKQLEDPDRPGSIDLSSRRASDIDVIYELDGENGRSYRKKSNLQGLIDEHCPGKALKVQISHDPALALLRTADTLTRQLELIAKAMGAIQEQKNVSISIATGTIEDIAAIAGRALQPYPEALEAFSAAIMEASHEEVI